MIQLSRMILVIGLALITSACGQTVTVTAKASPIASVAVNTPTLEPTAESLPPPTVPTPESTPPSILPIKPFPITIVPSLKPYTHLVYAQKTLANSDVGPVTVSCPTGQVALAGGWATDGRGSIYNSSRISNGWQIYVNHSSSTLVNVYAECLVNLSNAKVFQRLKQISVPANTSSELAIAQCQTGEIAVGAGFALSSTTFLKASEVTASQSGLWGWGFTFGNYGSALALANGYAICLQGNYQQQNVNGPAQTVTPGNTGSSSANCPQGYYATGGSYTLPSSTLVYNNSPNTNGWETYIKVLNILGSPPVTVTTHVQCVKFS
jgi:hypothetical protein